MINGFGIDVNHQNDDVSAGVKIVENFIARADDPDFVEGAWVIGVHVLDDDIWNDILSGELNGFSYEALKNTPLPELKMIFKTVNRKLDRMSNPDK